MQVRPGNLLNEEGSVLQVVPQGGVLRSMLNEFGHDETTWSEMKFADQRKYT